MPPQRLVNKAAADASELAAAAAADAKSNPVAAYARFEDDHWWFLARKTILRRLVTQLMKPSSDRLVIDVGCGPGGNLASLAGMYRCLGADSSERAIAMARERFPNLDFVCGNAPDCIAEHAEVADLWLLMDVLEHVDDDQYLLARLVAAAKPGAHFLITVPADPDLWSPHDDAAGHRRRYTTQTLAALWADLPLRPRLLSAYNAHLYRAVKAIRRVTALRRGSYGGELDAEGLDLKLPPSPFNALLTGLFSNEAMRLSQALAGEAPPYQRGVSLIAILERGLGDVHIDEVKPTETSALTPRELGRPNYVIRTVSSSERRH